MKRKGAILDNLSIMKEAKPMPLSDFKNEKTSDLLRVAEGYWGRQISQKIGGTVLVIADRPRCIFLIVLLMFRHDKTSVLIPFSPVDDCLTKMNLSWLSGRAWDEIDSHIFRDSVVEMQTPLVARFVTSLYRQKHWWPKTTSRYEGLRMDRGFRGNPRFILRPVKKMATPLQKVLWLQKVMSVVTNEEASQVNIDMLAVKEDPRMWETGSADSLAISLFGFDSTLLKDQNLFEFRMKALTTWPSLSDEVRMQFQPVRHSISQPSSPEVIEFENEQASILAERLHKSMAAWLEKAVSVFQAHLSTLPEEEKKIESEEESLEQRFLDIQDFDEDYAESNFSVGWSVNVVFQAGLWMNSTNSVIYYDDNLQNGHHPLELHLKEDPVEFIKQKLLMNRPPTLLLSIARLSVQPWRIESDYGSWGFRYENDEFPELEDWSVKIQPDYEMDALKIFSSS